MSAVTTEITGGLPFDAEVVVGRHGDGRGLGQVAGATWKSFWGSRWTRLLGPLLLLGAWQLVSMLNLMPSNELSSPATVWRTGVSLVKDGTLTSALGVSARRVALGLLLGITIGSLLALASGLARVGERLIDPNMQMIRTMPVLAMLPLFVLWFGIGEEAKVFIVAWAVAFPIYLNLYAGIRGVDEKLVTAGRVLGLGRLGLIRHVILPGAMPQFLTGLRIGMGVAWLVLVAAEEINASSGLGAMITNAENLSQTSVIFVGLISFALLGLLTDLIVRLIERWSLSWRSSFVTSN